jgi:hypothetical protein
MADGGVFDTPMATDKARENLEENQKAGVYNRFKYAVKYVVKRCTFKTP